MTKKEAYEKIHYALRLRHALHRNTPLGVRGIANIRKSNIDCEQCQKVEEAMRIVEELQKGEKD